MTVAYTWWIPFGTMHERALTSQCKRMHTYAHVYTHVHTHLLPIHEFTQGQSRAQNIGEK
jgi:hypothetical protein